MTMNAQTARELQKANADMRAYADTLPVGSDERQEYEDAIALNEGNLREYAAQRGGIPARLNTDEDSDGDTEDDTDDEELDDETEGNLAELAAQLRAEGYDVGDPEEMVAGQPARNYSAARPAPAAADPVVAEMLREDVDTRVDALVSNEHLLPFEGQQVKIALYALLDATPEGGVVGGLRIYSRDEVGATPATDRRQAVRDILAVIGAREPAGLTRTYSRDEDAAPAAAGGPALNLTIPDDVAVNQQSVELAHGINQIMSRDGCSWAEATRTYEREKGKVTLKKY